MLGGVGRAPGNGCPYPISARRLPEDVGTGFLVRIPPTIIVIPTKLERHLPRTSRPPFVHDAHEMTCEQKEFRCFNWIAKGPRSMYRGIPETAHRTREKV